MLAVESRVFEPVWITVQSLIPPIQDNHPLGCHRPRVSDHLCFKGIVTRLVTGCSWAVAAYAVGVGETPVHDDGSLLDAGGLPAAAGRIAAYAGRALPGLEPEPVDVRHCWVTELPWSTDGIAVWQLGGLLVVAGNNLFKHAPALGRAVAAAALGEELAPMLRPEAKLGAERPA